MASKANGGFTLTDETTVVDVSTAWHGGTVSSDGAFDALVKLDARRAVRDFTDTLAIKRAIGENLSARVVKARDAGADNVGKAGDAVRMAHVGMALGLGASGWDSYRGRSKATLADDLNAWLYATPGNVATYRKVPKGEAWSQTIVTASGNTRNLSRDNAQHAVQWCFDRFAVKTQSNAGSGAGKSDARRAPLKVTPEQRVSVATDLQSRQGSDTMDAPAVAHAPAIVTPSWLIGLTDSQLDAIILACEGERKRRAVAATASKGKAGTVPAAPSAPDEITVDAVASVSAAPAAPAIDPAMVAAIMAAMNAVKA